MPVVYTASQSRLRYSSVLCMHEFLVPITFSIEALRRSLWRFSHTSP